MATLDSAKRRTTQPPAARPVLEIDAGASEGLIATGNHSALKVFVTRVAEARTPTVRTRWWPRGAIVAPALRSSAGLVAVAAIFLSACATSNAPAGSRGASADKGRTFATSTQVLEAVKAAQSVDDVPSSVGFLTNADWPDVLRHFDCHSVDDVPANIVDPRGQCSGNVHLVLTRHQADGYIRRFPCRDVGGGARRHSFKERVPAAQLPYGQLPDSRSPFLQLSKRVPDEDCYQFRQSAIAAIRKLHPDLLLVTSFSTHMLVDLASRPPIW